MGALESTDLPTISVVMPVFNGERFLAASISSILNQTFANFELIVVDDASTDTTPQILDSFVDERLIRLYTERNLRAAGARNQGISIARGRYLAFQDADDISYPSRLAKQVQYMEANRHVGLLGTSYHVIDDAASVTREIHPPEQDTEVRWRALFGNPFCQSTMMIRRSVVESGQQLYDESSDVAGAFVEDYEAWTRLLQFTCGANLIEPLVGYRLHDANMSAVHEFAQNRMSLLIARAEMRRVMPTWLIAEEGVDSLCRCHRCKGLRRRDVAECAKIFDLFRVFCTVDGMDSAVVARLQREWMQAFIARLPARYWYEFVSSGLLRTFLANDLELTMNSLGRLGPARLSKKMRRWHNAESRIE